MKAVYLDTSILVELERHGDADPAIWRRVNYLTNSVPLCLSFASLAELARGNIQPSLLSMAARIDATRPAWIRPENELENIELLNLFSSKLGIALENGQIFGFSIYDAFIEELKHTQVVGLVTARPTLRDFLRLAHGQGQLMVTGMFERCGAFLDKINSERRNRNRFRTNKSGGKAYVDAKLLNNLRSKAAALFQEKLTHIPEIASSISLGSTACGLAVVPPPAEVAATITEADLFRIPFWLTRHEVSFALSYSLPDPTSPKYLSKLMSDAGDLLHLGGAAYCEIFTCDKRVKPRVDPIRDRLGLSPCLKIAGQGPEALHDLLTTIESLV